MGLDCSEIIGKIAYAKSVMVGIFFTPKIFLHQKVCFLHQMLKFRKRFFGKNWCEKNWCKKLGNP